MVLFSFSYKYKILFHSTFNLVLTNKMILFCFSLLGEKVLFLLHFRMLYPDVCKEIRICFTVLHISL